MSLAETVLTTPEAIRDTYDIPHYADIAVRYLEDHGVFPATYGNPKIQLATTGGLFAYFDNHIEVHGHVAVVRFGENMDPELEKKLSEHLGWQEAKGEGAEKEPSKGRAFYSRLLAKMGFYTNKKPTSPRRNTRGANGSQLPEFLSTLIENYETFGKVDAVLAKQYLRNLGVAWTQCRRVQQSERFKVTFLSQPSENLLIKESELLMKTMNIVWGMDLQPKHRSMHENRFGAWIGDVTFPMEQMLAVEQRTPPPFKLRVESAASYAFDHVNHALNSSSD